MEEEQQFCLRWNNFQANITSQFEALRDEEDFVDVTLACDGQRIKAHRVVLSACSPYFKELFRSNPCTHPILFMRDVEFQHLQSLVEFMYAGEVNVAQAHLSSFLRTAESLQIRGLTEAPQRHKQDPKLATDSSLTTTSVARPQSSSPQESSQHNTSSPEEDDDEDMLSLSPSSSPPPAKRAKEQEEESTPTLPPPPSSQPVPPDTAQQIESSYKDDSPDLFEPKMEAPDYSSDGESKGAGFFGLDNSMDNPFSALHGSLDMFAGPSAQAFSGEASHDAAQAYHQKLHSLDPRPCPICNRMYSNLSNLRQHVRLIHNPQTVACPLCSKPFKTKLYLKRHLMSFHELQCTNPVNKQNVVQGSPDFFPPPQVFLGPLTSNSHPTDDKANLHNSLSKVKDYNPEYFHSSYHNLSNNGERPYPSQMGNAMELPSFTASQVSKEDGETPQTISEKPGMKNRDNSFGNSPPQVNSDFRSAFIPQQLGHGHPPNSDSLTTYANTNNDKNQSFLSSLSLSKSVDVADYLDPEIHVNEQTSPKHIKEPESTERNTN